MGTLCRGPCPTRTEIKCCREGGLQRPKSHHIRTGMRPKYQQKARCSPDSALSTAMWHRGLLPRPLTAAAAPRCPSQPLFSGRIYLEDGSAMSSPSSEARSRPPFLQEASSDLSMREEPLSSGLLKPLSLPCFPWRTTSLWRQGLCLPSLFLFPRSQHAAGE